MKRLQEEQMHIVALACGVMLMLGWFTFATVRMEVQTELAGSDSTRPCVPVLMYHHILPQDEITGLFKDNNVVVSLEQFKRDIQVLKDSGYETISLRQLNDFVRDGAEIPAKSVVITFDDGYLSNKVYAMPVLQEAGYTAVIFALTGWMEEYPQTFCADALQYLSWPEIKEMRRVFQFASHTDNMHSLSWNGKGSMTAVPKEDAAADLQRSVHKLQGTVYFSYPYGHYSEKTRDVLLKQGIELAFTVNPVSVYRGDDPMALGRWDMYQYSLTDILPGIAK
jgi:peptidoglycan/xylan/chitin deacetylase (PgdA/CDA1 family)